MDKLKVGIMGCGKIAEVMAATLQQMDSVTLYAVASRDEAKAAAFAQKYGAEKSYGSYKGLACDDSVQLIYVASPHSHHCEHTLLCLENGKPVLCEKAFAANLAETQLMLETAAANKIFITEAMWTRFQPLAKTVQQLIAQGAIGKPMMVTANHGQNLTHIDRLTNPALAGGALLDLTVYPINLASMALGTGVESFSSDVRLYHTGVDAVSTITLHYPGLQTAVLISSFVNQMDQRWYVYGDEGTLEIEGVCQLKSIRLLSSNGREAAFYPCPPTISGYEYEVQACAEALREGRLSCPEMPHAETQRIMALMDDLRTGWGIRFPFETA